MTKHLTKLAYPKRIESTREVMKLFTCKLCDSNKWLTLITIPTWEFERKILALKHRVHSVQWCWASSKGVHSSRETMITQTRHGGMMKFGIVSWELEQRNQELKGVCKKSQQETKVELQQKFILTRILNLWTNISHWLLAVTESSNWFKRFPVSSLEYKLYDGSLRLAVGLILWAS